MANSKINFAGLVKISGNQWDAYVSAKTNGAGKIIFADITSEGHVGKYIYANGIEYKVADASNFDALVKRVEDVSQYSIDVSSALSTLNTHVTSVTDASVNALQTWKPGVDASLGAFDTSIKDHENRIKDLEDASSTHGSAIADLSTYVHNTVDASIDNLQAKDQEIDSSISDISSRLASVAITAADGNISVNGSSINVESGKYVNVTATNNTLTVGLADSSIQDGGSSEGHDKLATKGYVDEQVAILEQALVFKGEVTSETAEGLLTTAATQAGWTYVATGNAFDYNSKHIEAGDLVIVTSDAAAGTTSSIIVVERNLDGAVTAAAALDNDYVILGSGNQAVKVSTIEVNALLTAITNANSAIQNIVANSSSADYLDASAAISSSTGTITIGVKVQDLSTADADHKGLAKAEDVRQKLEEVEEVMAAANTAMADTLGLNSSYGVNWSEESGIESGTSYKEAIEGAYAAAMEAGVTSFGGATGEITLDHSTTDGDVSFGMNSSTLVGKVSGWNTLVGRVADVSAHAEANDASIVDLSTNVIPTINSSITNINNSINTLNSSVNALEQWHNNTSFVNTIAGDDYVKVDKSSGDVTLSTEIGDIPTATADASGLATAYDVSVFVNDQLSWAVISD